MIKPKFFIFAYILLFMVNAVFAQTEEKDQIEQSYEVILHVVVASNNQNEKGKLPPSLSGVINNLKNDYLYTDYALAGTFLERISTNGVIGHTGVFNQLKRDSGEKNYFSEWGLSGLQAGKNEKGNDVIHFQTFNFGAKVPVVTATIAKGDGGGEIINYESIGIRLTRFNLPENKPTIIGSLATPKTDEFIFLILTVRPV